MKKIIKTGIIGFDELLDGGIPQGKSILLTGGPGTGKTTFGIQFIYNGITLFDQPGIIVTLDESALMIKENMKVHGWDLDELEKEGKLAVIDALPIVELESNNVEYKLPIKPHPILGTRKFEMKDIISLIHEKRRELNAERIVIDSLSPLLLHEQDIFKIRQDILQLVRSLKYGKMTSILISENMRPGQIGTYNVEPFLTEGVFLMQVIRNGNTRIRSLEILKLRGINHSMDASLYKITKNGIIVYPEEKVFREDEYSIIL